MAKIIITEHPYFGHGTMAQHVYEVSEDIANISFDKYGHELRIDFTSCTDVMVLKIDDLRGIKIEGV